jgi:hypothetical protein
MPLRLRGPGGTADALRVLVPRQVHVDAVRKLLRDGGVEPAELLVDGGPVLGEHQAPKLVEHGAQPADHLDASTAVLAERTAVAVSGEYRYAGSTPAASSRSPTSARISPTSAPTKGTIHRLLFRYWLALKTMPQLMVVRVRTSTSTSISASIPGTGLPFLRGHGRSRVAHTTPFLFNPGGVSRGRRLGRDGPLQ